VQFSPEDQPALETLYAAAYPGNWFAPRMLQTGCYYGIREGDSILCVAGVHVYSPAYRVAALGNVTTHPAWRGRGLGTAACAKLCTMLLEQGVDRIGLNVKADNHAAITSYTRLGFTKVAEYGEFTFDLKRE
jgi:predicted GNAT family acetyltransferase